MKKKLLFLVGLFILMMPTAKADSYYNVWQTDWKYNNQNLNKLQDYEDIFGRSELVNPPTSLNFSTNIPLNNKPQRVRFHLLFNYTYYYGNTLGFSDCGEWGYCASGVINGKDTTNSLLVSMKQEILSTYCEFVANDDGVFTVDCPVVSASRPITGLRFEVTGDSKVVTFGVGAAVTFIYEDTNASLEQQEQTNQKLDELKSNQNANTQKEIDAMNKNQQQANQNSQNEVNATNKNTEATKEQTSYLKDTTEPETDISALGNVQGIFPPGPADSLLNIPFKFLSIITSSFGGVCTPIKTGIWKDVDVVIPCFSEKIYANVPDWLMIYLDLIPAGYILIKYFKYLYKKIDRATSLESNSDDEWGVL